MKLTEIYDSIVSEGSSAFAEVIAILEQAGARYAVIGGLAVNAYVEPVFTADADIVITLSEVDQFTEALLDQGYGVKQYPFSLNFRKEGSDLSLQVSTDPAYQDFLDRSEKRDVLGIRVNVASLPDLVEGKIRAWSDPERRLSKRAKDRADLLRIAERYPEMTAFLPEKLKAEIAEDRAARLYREAAEDSRSTQPRAEREPPGIDR